MSRRADAGDAGVMPVLEAILVAILVLAAILFVTNVQRPLAARQESGLDLGDLAAQSVTLLLHQDIKDANQVLHTPESWVNKTLAGDPVVAAAVTNVLEQMLPEGARYTLSLTNGHGAARLLPLDDPGQPRNGRGAEVPFFANWTAFRAQATPTIDAEWGAPGQDISTGHPGLLDLGSATSGIQCVKAPNNATKGPGGATWRSIWSASTPKVPDNAIYGVWAGYTTADCTGTPTTYARVALEDGTVTDFPIYGLRLMVWYGA